MSFVGRPNVGKSTLQNKLLQENRLIVSPISGTTRDSVSSKFSFEGEDFLLIDTAGIRKPSLAHKKFLDRLSTQRAQKAIEKSDVTALVIDAEEGIVHQDLAIANMILKAKNGFILAVNKWDKKGKGETAIKRMLHQLKVKFAFARWVEVVFTSGKTGKNVFDVLRVAQNIYKERQKRISTAELNKFLSEALINNPPKSKLKIPAKFFYATQVDVNPPHFLFFVNSKEAVHFSYRRYLENKIRERYGFSGTGIKIEMRLKNQDAEGNRRRRKNEK